MTQEHDYLSGLVDKAFAQIEDYNTLGYKLLGGINLLHIIRSGHELQQQPTKFDLFRASQLYSIAQEELRDYVFSPDFQHKMDAVKAKHEHDQKIALDEVNEVQHYLMEVGRVGGLFEYSEPLRDWMTQQFLQSKDKEGYIRSACKKILHSGDRQRSFDDALGFELEAAVDPEYLTRESLRGIKISDEKRILEPELYEKVQHQIRESSSDALLFSHPVIQWLVYHGVTHAPRSIPALRLEYFLNAVGGRGVIAAFEERTPSPAGDPQESGDIQKFTQWMADAQKYMQLRRQFQFKFLVLAPELPLRLVEDATPERKLEDQARLHASGTLRFFRWNLDEKEQFSQKVINHLLHDPKAYDTLSVPFTGHKGWSQAMEFLAYQSKPLLEALVKEINTNEPQRSESKFKSGMTVDRLRFASEPYPARELEKNGKKYRVEMDRSLASVITILFDREMRDNTLDDGSAPHAIAKVAADFDHQFMSVYEIKRDCRENVGAVWLDGSSRLGGSKLDYYDEIDHFEGKISQLRPKLLQYAHDFARHCGFTEVEFDSNDLIVPDRRNGNE